MREKLGKEIRFEGSNSHTLVTIIGNRCVFAHIYTQIYVIDIHTYIYIRPLLRYEFSGAKSRARRDVIEI